MGDTPHVEQRCARVQHGGDVVAGPASVAEQTVQRVVGSVAPLLRTQVDPQPTVRGDPGEHDRGGEPLALERQQHGGNERAADQDRAQRVESVHLAVLVVGWCAGEGTEHPEPDRSRTGSGRLTADCRADRAEATPLGTPT